MAIVFVPSGMRQLSGGVESIELSGATVRELLDQLDARFPGLRERLCDGDQLRTGLAVSIDGRIRALGLLQKVAATSEVHFIPAIGGG